MRAALVLCLPYASGLRATPSMPTSVMAPASFLLRLAAPTLCAKAGATSAEAGGYRSREDLKAGIAKFYDESSGLWERVWGEHMHHGYYPKGKPTPGPRQAQEDMISEVLRWSGATDGDTPPGRVLDVGCGIGGSTRYMARTLGCAGNGISLSPKQIGRAQALSEAQGLGKKLSFEVADALKMPFADNSFDLVWSLESGEHMPDKAQFVSELVRVLRPGGRLIIVAWCHRDLLADETQLQPKEEKLLRRISWAYYLPPWCSVADYRTLLTERGMRELRTDDWTEEVRKFWPAVMLSSLRPKSIIGMFGAGWKTFRGALAMPLMARGQKKGVIKFGLLTAKKPEAASTTTFGSQSAAVPTPPTLKAPEGPAPSTAKVDVAVAALATAGGNAEVEALELLEQAESARQGKVNVVANQEEQLRRIQRLVEDAE